MLGKIGLISYLIFIFAAIPATAQIFIPFSYWSCNRQTMLVEDKNAADFGGGTFSNTTLTGNSIYLSASQTTGTFTSRVQDIFCGSLYSWYSFFWRTSLPFGKEIPATSEVTSEYSGVQPNLMSNLLVYHNFNETAGNSAPGGTDFADRSGNGNHATETNLGAFGVTGKFINAARFNGTTSRVTPGFTSTAKNYTFSFWFRTTMSANTLSFLYDTLDGTNRLIIAPTCNNTLCNTQGRIAVGYGNISSLVSTTIAAPVDGNWHHLVVTFSTATGNVVVYLDATTTYTYTTYGTTGNNLVATARIGSRYDSGNYFFNGDLDEVAIWERTFSAAEVLQLYRRGINRVLFQFRSCTSSSCADNPAWRGPNGTNATYFSELNNNSNQLNMNGSTLSGYPFMILSNFTSLGLPQNRYFQYRATLQTDNVTYSPDLQFTRSQR